MSIFKPIKIKDPITGKEVVVSEEQQEEMLERGVFFDVPTSEDKEIEK
jgi:hypothetical protein